MSMICLCGKSSGPFCDGAAGCHFATEKPVTRIVNDFTFGTGVDTRKSGDELIAEERMDQVIKHGHSIVNDLKENQNNELILAVFGLINHKYGEMPDTWDKGIIDKMMAKTYSQRLVIAGALIAAEIDRLNLAAQIKTAYDNDQKQDN